MLKKLFLSFVLFLTLFSAKATDMIDVINSFRADKYALMNTYNLKESEEYYQRFERFYDSWETKLKAMNFKELSQDGKADFVLLKNLIAKERYFLEIDYKAFQEVSHVTNFGAPVYQFIRERRRGKKPDAAKLAMAFTDMDAEIHLRMADHKPFSDWLKADKASKVVGSLKKALKEAFDFYNNYDPEFTWWMQKPFEKLNKSLEDYEAFLQKDYDDKSIKDDGSGIIGRPIGRDAIVKSLAYEFIPYTPEEMIEAAKKQYEWCKAEMIKASEAMGYGKDWRAALEHVKETYVPAGEQPQAITDLYNQSVDFIEKRDLITLPEMAKENWGMIMMTPERQRVNPFFTGGWEISISYPTQEMSEEDKLMSMRGNNPNFSRATVQHELLPGHNLQFFMNSRYKSYRRAFDTPFWMEGWALYWEIVLWNKEFPQTPEQKMGMLFWRIHRCARIMFSLKYHLGEMTPQQCIDMLVDEVGHEYANAEAEVRRSFATSYVPLYQMAYMTGGLQFYALRKEMLEKGWTEKQFHDRVMQENNMPVEILRMLLQETPIPENYSTRWKFSTDFK